jgi:DNA helicase-2/ATP-dependent DNA helicase PcrA
MKGNAVMKELNPPQREAVLNTEGYLLVLAGAGSGKTRVLTERIVHLIRDRKISPERILAFTFTNKAAGEMRSRVERSLARQYLPFWVGTFHATGLKILRKEAKHLGFGNNFAIYDEDDSISLIKDIVKKKGFRLDEYPPSAVKDRISKWKNTLVPPDEAIQNAGDPVERIHADVYSRYVDALRNCNAFDFDDLITRVVELFSAHPKIKQRYARQFRYVMVDEFQDTNTIQMVMIDGLSSHHKNLFVVGDDDQAIYGWRGATIDNILQFDRVYGDTVTIRLEENYRSTNRILEAANCVISNNQGRKGKSLWSKKGKGDLISLYFAEDDVEEANAVRERIVTMLRSGYKRSEIAVLYRTHAQSRAIENALRRGGLPYQIIGGVRFYERKEIKDLLGYLKLIYNPRDDVSFRRIVNVPRRGIGRITLDRLEKAAGGEPLLLSLGRGESLSAMPGAQRERLEKFTGLIASLQLTARKKSVYDLLAAVIEETGYRSYLEEDPKTAQTRLENIEELLVETQRFTADAEEPGLGAFLEEIALINDIDKLKSGETVALMTLHNSKGLEYRAVLITGLEEGLLPHYSSLDITDELEEERRLFYVGMTRAKEKLFVFSAANRMRFGSWVDNEPSRFLREIPESLIEVTGDDRMAPLDDGMLRDAESSGHGSRDEGRTVMSRRFHKGARIIHPTYGEGTIRQVEGSGQDMKVTVQFPGKGSKKFLAHYAPFRFL